jgi:hypothetical protein
VRQSAISSGILLCAIAFAPLWGQSTTEPEWRVDQQPQSAPCTADDIAFATAPEQIELEKTYGVPTLDVHDAGQFTMTCESIKGPAFYGARVLRIARPSVIDDGEAYTLIQPQGSAYVRLVPFSAGGNLFWGNESDRHNLAAMNAILLSSGPATLQNIDWLATCLAYLTIMGEEPNLADLHYDPGPNEHFKSYTVAGFLSEVPELRKKHLLPTVKCETVSTSCVVDFYYRTEPEIVPLKHASFGFILEGDHLSLRQVAISDYERLVLGRKNHWEKIDPREPQHQ